MGWLAQVARSIFTPFTTGGVGPSYALSVSPKRLRLSATSVVTFAGTSTAWLSTPPSLIHASTHSLTVGTPDVISDTSFTVTVTTGIYADRVTWTDESYGISAVQLIGGGGRSPGTFF